MKKLLSLMLSLLLVFSAIPMVMSVSVAAEDSNYLFDWVKDSNGVNDFNETLTPAEGAAALSTNNYSDKTCMTTNRALVIGDKLSYTTKTDVAKGVYKVIFELRAYTGRADLNIIVGTEEYGKFVSPGGGSNTKVTLFTNYIQAETAPVTISFEAKSAGSFYIEQLHLEKVDFMYTASGSEIVINEYLGSATDLEIPETIDGYTVVGIGAEAFKDCATLETVSIPGTVESIGENAFAGCTALTSIEFKSSTSEIFDAATTIPEQAVIHGFLNSTAQVYAEKYDREFSEIVFAKIGETNYPSLDDAIKDANAGDRIVLVKDFVMKSDITVDKYVIIDLAGFAIDTTAKFVATDKLVIASTKDGLGEEYTDTKASIKFGSAFVSTSADFEVSNVSAVARATGSFYTNSSSTATPKFVAKDSAFSVSNNGIVRPLQFSGNGSEIDMENCTVACGDNHNNSGFTINSNSFGTFKNTTFKMNKGFAVVINKTDAQGITFDGCKISQSSYDQGAVLNITGGTVKLTGDTVVDGGTLPATVLSISGGNLTIDGATIKGDKGDASSRNTIKITNSPKLNILKAIIIRKGDGSGSSVITNDSAKLRAGIAAGKALFEANTYANANQDTILNYEKAVGSCKYLVVADCEHYNKRLDAGCTQSGTCRYCNGTLEANGHTPNYEHDKDGHWLVCLAENCETLISTGTEYVGEKEAHKGGTATCTTLANCEVCNTPYGETKPHTFTNYVKDDTHSCEHNTVKVATCDDGCGTKDYNYDEATNYVVSKEAKAPTCTEKGNTVEWKCKECDTILNDSEEIDETGHTFGEDVIETDSDYLNTGVGSHTCQADGCGFKEEIVIPVKSFKASTVAIVGDYSVEGTTQYSNLAAAFAAADEDDVVILVKDVDIDTPITLTRKAVLDTAGHVISTGTDSSTFVTDFDFELRSTKDGLGEAYTGTDPVAPSNPEDTYGTIADVSDGSYYVMGHYSSSNGKLESYENRIGHKKLIAVEYGTTYTFTTGSTNSKLEFVVREYNEKGVFVASKGAVANGATYTPSKDNVKLISVAFWINGDSSSNILSAIQNGNFTPSITRTPVKAKVNFAKPFVSTTATFTMSNIQAVSSANTSFVTTSATDVNAPAKLIAKDCDFAASGSAVPLKFTSGAIELDITDSSIRSTTGNGFEVASTSVFGTIKNTKISKNSGAAFTISKTAAAGITFDGCNVSQGAWDSTASAMSGGTVILTGGTQISGSNMASTVLNVSGGSLTINGATLSGDKGTDTNRRLLYITNSPTIKIIKANLNTGTANGARGLITNNWTKLLDSIQKGSWIYETAEKNGEFIYSRDTDFTTFRNLYVNICDHYETTATCSEAGECVYCTAEIEPLGCDDLGFGSNDEVHWKQCSRCGTKVEGTDEAHTEGSAATCTTAKRCSVCRNYYGESLGHDYSAVGHDDNDHWTECSRCQEEKPDTRVAHTGGEAKCYAYAVCDGCGFEYGEKPDHVWGEYKQLTPPDCDNNATERAFCTNEGCSEHDTREVPNTKRAHNEVIIDEIPATCTSTGWSEWSYCSHCDVIIKTKQLLPQLNYHTWDEGRLDGVDCEHSDLIYTCVGCGTTKNVDIIDSVNNHTVKVTSKAATYFATGYKNRKTCTVCGKVVSKGTTIAKKVLKTPTVKYTAVKGKKIKVKYSRVSGAAGFQVRYKIKGAKKWTIKKFTTKKAKTIYLKKLKAGKKYYVQTRAFVTSGKKIAYSKWSKQKTLTAKK